MIDEFLEAAKNGDQEALSEIYRHFFPKIFHFILKKVGSHETAEDITSEVFLQMLKSISLFRSEGPGKFQGWLYQIATFRIADHYRYIKRKETLSLDQHEEYSSIDEITHHEEWMVIVEGINMLHEEHRQIIIDRFILGYSFAAIARLTGKQESAMKTRHSRAIQNLRKILS